MFLFNISSNHWISVAVVNPIVIYEKFLAEGNDNEFIELVDEIAANCVTDKKSFEHIQELTNATGTGKCLAQLAIRWLVHCQRVVMIQNRVTT